MGADTRREGFIYLAVVIFSSNPLFVALAAALILRERLSAARLAGILVGFAGVRLAFSGWWQIKSGSGIDV
jgi:drug/metabolite transporter (DMT)-like permease